MKQVGMARKVYRFRTSDLVERKAELTRDIVLATTFRNGTVGLIAFAVPNIIDLLFSASKPMLTGWNIAVLASVALSAVIFIFFSILLAELSSEKELLSDILALRMNALGKSKRNS